MLVLHNVKFYAACLKRPKAYFPHQMSDKRFGTRRAYRSVSSLGLSSVASWGRYPGMQLLEEKNSPCLKLGKKRLSGLTSARIVCPLETQSAVWTHKPVQMGKYRYFGCNPATTNHQPQDHLIISKFPLTWHWKEVICHWLTDKHLHALDLKSQNDFLPFKLPLENWSYVVNTYMCHTNMCGHVFVLLCVISMRENVFGVSAASLPHILSPCTSLIPG